MYSMIRFREPDPMEIEYTCSLSVLNGSGSGSRRSTNRIHMHGSHQRNCHLPNNETNDHFAAVAYVRPVGSSNTRSLQLWTCIVYSSSRSSWQDVLLVVSSLGFQKCRPFCALPYPEPAVAPELIEWLKGEDLTLCSLCKSQRSLEL